MLIYILNPELFVGTVLLVWTASNYTIRTDTDILLAAGLISIVDITAVKYILSYIYTKANICKQYRIIFENSSSLFEYMT